ncbi:MAG: serine--tRNA ligase [Proteobacteria bacterium]|nr:serine--tRNA ligase [Pseudomonadota bacterium]
MFDIKWIRENQDAFDRAMTRRGLAPQAAGLIALDTTRRDAQTKAQDIQAERNRLSKDIGAAKAKGEDAQAIMDEVSKTKAAEAEAEKAAEAASVVLNKALSELPNLPADDVPDGPDEASNVEIRSWGDKPNFDFPPKEHFDIGEALGLMDFDTAAKMSGARFVLLSGALARMERALANFMLDLHTSEHALTEVNPPALVNDAAMFGTGQLPKFGEDLFKTEDGLWLIPTAEVPLTNIVAGAIIEAEYLPRRYTAMTWCFRSEAGASGKDTRGMIRQHQFTKVEMVTVCAPETSADELERMTGCAEEVLKRLKLPFRTVVLCTGDMGFGAQKTYDIEVWLPGQDRYREISSCSNCGDFQARRMKARFKAKGEKGTQFVHTLNGSGLAVGRTLVAVLENYQQADGSVVVPDALRPYMGGLEVIPANGA